MKHTSNTPDSEQPILEAVGIDKAFPGVQALSNVDFAVYAGQVNVVVGENGAGKSTLMSILSGVCSPDNGTIRMCGSDIVFTDTLAAQQRGVTIIHQELNLIPQLTVAENIFLGREFQTRSRLIDYGRMNRRAAEILDQLELSVAPTTAVSRLRVGQQQVVEIAKALSIDAQVLIMDEPTSAISNHEVEVLFRRIEALKKRGVAIVYISHKLEELFRIGDRMTVLRDGRKVFAGPMEGLRHDDIVHHMVGRDVQYAPRQSRATTGSEVLRVERMRLQSRDRAGALVVDGVDFHVCRGEVLGVFGLMGASRTELLETIFGMHDQYASGSVFVEGEKTPIRSPEDAIRAGIALAPEDRKEEGLVLGMDVASNISLACLEKIRRLMLLSRRRESSLADRFVRRLRIKTPSTRQRVRNLSGGNQQKVILAKWMATEPKVLLLDEPTRGIDVNAKQEIYELIDTMTREGLAVVLVSSEMPEILSVADRILVMSEGRKTAEFSRDQATADLVLKAALPRSV